jgi:hypothetical protein
MLINNAGFGSMRDFARLDLASETRDDRSQCEVAGGVDASLLAANARPEAGHDHQRRFDAGFQPVPYMATYAATKAFVLSFSEALWEENRVAWGSCDGACVPGDGDELLCGGEMARPPLRTIQQRKEVVEVRVRAVAPCKPSVISGWSN